MFNSVMHYRLTIVFTWIDLSPFSPHKVTYGSVSPPATTVFNVNLMSVHIKSIKMIILLHLRMLDSDWLGGVH